jgi:hypothetical protein
MTVTVTKSEINVRDTLTRLDTPQGVFGAQLMATNNITDLYTIANPAMFRNRIINGDCRIDQRNAGASIAATDGGKNIDRWQTILNVGTFNVQQNAGSVTPPPGFAYYLGATVTSASASPTGTTGIRYKVEGYDIADWAWGTANARPVTMSFWVYSSLTGMFGGGIWNSTQAYSFPFTYSVTTPNTWTYVTVPISGPTVGTWLTNNGVGIGIDFSLGTGSGNQGAPGYWNSGYKQGATGQINPISTNGATFYITGLQVELGTQATPFEFRSYNTELQLCQRYYEQVFEPFGGGRTNAGQQIRFFARFTVMKRAQPTIGYTGLFSVSDMYTTDTTQTSGGLVGVAHTTVSGTVFGIANSTLGVTNIWNTSSTLAFNLNNGASITASAEL